MSYRKKDQVFQHASLENLEERIASAVSEVLRQEYKESSAAIKLIHRRTGISMRAIRNWYEGRNAPSSVHLIQLARIYPGILHALLELIGRPDVWEYCQMQPVVGGREDDMEISPSIYYEKNFVINVALNPVTAAGLNQRQLWFLGLLQQRHKVRAADIAATWQVTLRTAQMDIASLVQANLVQLVGARKTGRYEILIEHDVLAE